MLKPIIQGNSLRRSDWRLAKRISRHFHRIRRSDYYHLSPYFPTPGLEYLTRHNPSGTAYLVRPSRSFREFARTSC